MSVYNARVRILLMMAIMDVDIDCKYVWISMPWNCPCARTSGALNLSVCVV